MNSLLILTIVAGFAAYAQSCCTPDQWEGFEGGQSGYSARWRKGGGGEVSFVSYDYTNKRSSVYMTSYMKHKEYKFHIISLHGDGENSGKKYVIDLKTNKCYTKSACCGMRKACIPKQAKGGKGASLGLKDGGLPVKFYQFHKDEVFAGLTVAPIGNSTDLCVPIGETLQGRYKRVDFMAVMGFSDITPGIKNATVFEVPKICDEEESDVSMTMEIERDHFILAV